MSAGQLPLGCFVCMTDVRSYCPNRPLNARALLASSTRASLPIAPGVCPASPSYIEVQGLLFALVFLIVASSIALAYSFVKSTSVAATQG